MTSAHAEEHMRQRRPFLMATLFWFRFAFASVASATLFLGAVLFGIADDLRGTAAVATFFVALLVLPVDNRAGFGSISPAGAALGLTPAGALPVPELARWWCRFAIILVIAVVTPLVIGAPGTAPFAEAFATVNLVGALLGLWVYYRAYPSYARWASR